MDVVEALFAVITRNPDSQDQIVGVERLRLQWFCGSCELLNLSVNLKYEEKVGSVQRVYTEHIEMSRTGALQILEDLTLITWHYLKLSHYLLLFFLLFFLLFSFP